MSITRKENARNCALRELWVNHNPCRSMTGGCWPWPKYLDAKGYGKIFFDDFKFSVHRLSYEHYKGPIPEGMCVMHSCDNPACFNPDHLSLGTHTDNMRDMVRKGRHGKRKTTEEVRGIEAQVRKLAALKAMTPRPATANKQRKELQKWINKRSA